MRYAITPAALMLTGLLMGVVGTACAYVAPYGIPALAPYTIAVALLLAPGGVVLFAIAPFLAEDL